MSGQDADIFAGTCAAAVVQKGFRSAREMKMRSSRIGCLLVALRHAILKFMSPPENMGAF